MFDATLDEVVVVQRCPFVKCIRNQADSGGQQYFSNHFVITSLYKCLKKKKKKRNVYCMEYRRICVHICVCKI